MGEDTKMNRVGIQMLQIPEVRLNIISNLDCVNQGKISQSTVLYALF